MGWLVRLGQEGEAQASRPLTAARLPHPSVHNGPLSPDWTVPPGDHMATQRLCPSPQPVPPRTALAIKGSPEMQAGCFLGWNPDFGGEQPSAKHATKRSTCTEALTATCQSFLLAILHVELSLQEPKYCS